MDQNKALLENIRQRFGSEAIQTENTRDEILTIHVSKNNIKTLLHYLKKNINQPFTFLYDLTAIDMRAFDQHVPEPRTSFFVVYHLLSFDRNCDIRIKCPLNEEYPEIESITSIWPAANWYEREVYDMFGIRFTGHPNLSRILMPLSWDGHPLRKEHPARATEMKPFTMPEDKYLQEEKNLKFNPEDWGLSPHDEEEDFMFLNIGPQHPGTHGVLRLVLQMSGEDIVDMVPDIGFHHRGAEKMGERQSWHTYIPYTDRVDYLGGVLNNLAYLQAVELLAGIEIPPRAQVIRVMLSELFRISSHLVWFGTYAQDLGQMSPVFYMFNDREKILDIVSSVTGDRMHPNWFRIGGVAQDLPHGWQEPIRDFINSFPKRLKEYNKLIIKNKIFRDRTIGIGAYTLEEAIEWGVTGPGLRACGLEWDFRKKRPYSGYDQFDFEIPTAQNGDSFDRGIVRLEELWQSLRIIEQCVNNMPEGHYKSDHPLTTPPRKERTMQDIETLINHFLNETWGPVMPTGEAFAGVEASKGHNGYYLISNGNTTSYRTRIRTPSFPHMQMLPLISQGHSVADLITILGSIDFVLADVDR